MPNTGTNFSESTKRPGRLTVRSSLLLLLIHKVRRCLFSLFLILFFFTFLSAHHCCECFSCEWFSCCRSFQESMQLAKASRKVFNSVSLAVRESWQVIPQREMWIRSHLINVRYNTTPYHIVEISQMMNILLEIA